MVQQVRTEVPLTHAQRLRGACNQAFRAGVADGNPEFTAEEVAVYYEELMKEALPLLDEAVYVYQQNLGVAARLGASNRFVDETRRRLGELINHHIPSIIQHPVRR